DAVAGVAQRFDRRACGDAPVERNLHRLIAVGYGPARERGLELAADDGGRKARAVVRTSAATAGNRRVLGQPHDLQGASAVWQATDEAALFEPADEAVDAGFGLE